jgi:hypothetical protein
MKPSESTPTVPSDGTPSPAVQTPSSPNISGQNEWPQQDYDPDEVATQALIRGLRRAAERRRQRRP